MLFKKLVNDIPHGDIIQQDNLVHVLLDVDFTKNPPAGFFATKDYCVFIKLNPPVCNIFQQAVEIDPVLIDNNTWQQQWEIQEMPDTEKNRITALKRQEVQGILLMKLDIAKDHLETEDFPDSYHTEVQTYIDQLNLVNFDDPFNIIWPQSPKVPISDITHDVYLI